MEEQQKTDTQRETPEMGDAETKLLGQWSARMDAAKEFWKDRFKKMKEDQVLARLGASEDWVRDGNYTVPLIRRQINQTVATIYAKNPTFQVKPRDRLRYTIWDGSAISLQMAMADPTQPGAAELIAEVQSVRQQELMLKRVARTAEILLDYYMNEQRPIFKEQMKMLVRRAKTVGAGYLWLDFQRLFEKRSAVQSQIDDITSKISLIERESADLQDGELQDDSPELAELKSNLADLESQASVITREGLVFDFLRGDEILIDPNVRQLKGFIGARWIAREYHMPVDEVQEIYNVDLRKAGYKRYTDDSDRPNEGRESTRAAEKASGKTELACVRVVYDKKARQRFVICEGYKGWLESPKSPDIEIEDFWPAFPLVFNEVDDCKEVIPPSYVADMKDAQLEYNRTRQSLREHRIANRPAYGVPKGRLTESDKEKLVNRPAHAVIEIDALQTGEKVGDVLQGIQPVGIDPNLYNVGEAVEDINRGAGSQDATIGVASSDSTATEATIADASRTKSDASDIDDIDEFMTAVARASLQILLLNLTPETAIKIVGPGAVWPSVDRATVVEELDLRVKAGSTGRPNSAAKLANMERAWPILQSLPGISPEPIGEEVGELLDLNVERLIAAGLPSIVAQNALAKPGAAGAGTPPTSDVPEEQGDQGADNAEKPEGQAPGPQAEMPAGKVVQFDAQGQRMVA